MGNSQPNASEDHITFIFLETGTEVQLDTQLIVKLSWSALASKFRRFESETHKGTSVSTNLPAHSFARLGAVLKDPGTAIMNHDDVKLLNWLQPKDFTDPYKWYSTTRSSPFAPPPPISDYTIATVDDDGRVNDHLL